MNECYFTPNRVTTSATICANCGLEKMLHEMGEGIEEKKVIIISNTKIEHQIEMEEEEYYFDCCRDCDLPDAWQHIPIDCQINKIA